MFKELYANDHDFGKNHKDYAKGFFKYFYSHVDFLF